jgi:hypothetical protein
MDVYDEGSNEELIITPPDIVNKGKNVKTADLLPGKSKQLYRVRKAMIYGIVQEKRNCKKL